MILLVGDIQGCDEAFGRLLAATGFSPSRDRLVILGDMVNRGPQSLAVLQRLMALGGAARCLLGNHDLHLLAAAAGVRRLRRDDTLADILHGPYRAACLDWVRAQPLALEESGWLCVHAGIPPSWSAAETLDRAAEVQAVLSGPQWAEALATMYGDEPARWSPLLQGPLRRRFIINALTRMRFCSADGELDLKTKEGAAGAPPGLMPWFEVPGRQSAGQAVAFGHWSTLGLINRPRLLALDTGCVWGGSLSAARVDDGRRDIIQVPCAQARRPG